MEMIIPIIGIIVTVASFVCAIKTKKKNKDLRREISIITMPKDDAFCKFPDLDNFEYEITIFPSTTNVIAWKKLQECERRLAVYKWAEGRIDARTGRNRVFLNDAVSAFLLTFEATLQTLKDQFNKMNIKLQFEEWIKTIRENDLLVRGLRTLRHLEAHIEPKPPPRNIDIVIGDSMYDGSSESSMSCEWRLPRLNADDLNKLKRPRIELSEIDDWNTIVSRNDVPALFIRSLNNLKTIVNEAEKLISK